MLQLYFYAVKSLLLPTSLHNKPSKQVVFWAGAFQVDVCFTRGDLKDGLSKVVVKTPLNKSKLMLWAGTVKFESRLGQKQSQSKGSMFQHQ